MQQKRVKSLFCKKVFHLVVSLLQQRFGSALVSTGQLTLKQKQYAKDFQPIDKDCPCSTCKEYTRAYLYSIINETVSCTLISIHNIQYQVSQAMYELIKHDIRIRALSVPSIHQMCDETSLDEIKHIFEEQMGLRHTLSTRTMTDMPRCQSVQVQAAHILVSAGKTFGLCRFIYHCIDVGTCVGWIKGYTFLMSLHKCRWTKRHHTMSEDMNVDS